MKSMVVAYDEKRGIGAENDLLWKRGLKADLAHFKQLTTGTSMVMGRNTYESIGFPLPNRQTIVLSRQALDLVGVIVVDSFEKAFKAATHEEITIIGGGQVYEAAVDFADRIYATEVKATFPQADTFFPVLSPQDWHETNRESHIKDENNEYDFDFVTIERTKQR